MLYKILDWLFGKPSKTEIEIRRVKKALERYHQQIFDMECAFNADGAEKTHCCIGCAYPYHSQLLEKIKRVEKVLARLEKRIGKGK